MKFLAILLATAFMFAPQRGEVIEQVLVKVNGDIITKTDLERRQIAALRERAKGRVDAETLKNDAELQKALVEVTGQILANQIDEMLMVGDAVRKLALEKADAGAIRNAAIGNGLVSLRGEGARKVMQGMTTPEEVLMVTAEAES